MGDWPRTREVFEQGLGYTRDRPRARTGAAPSSRGSERPRSSASILTPRPRSPRKPAASQPPPTRPFHLMEASGLPRAEPRLVRARKSVGFALSRRRTCSFGAGHAWISPRCGFEPAHVWRPDRSSVRAWSCSTARRRPSFPPPGRGSGLRSCSPVWKARAQPALPLATVATSGSAGTQPGTLACNAKDDHRGGASARLPLRRGGRLPPHAGVAWRA